jgi:C-terminal processing protease CtpA/Prc
MKKIAITWALVNLLIIASTRYLLAQNSDKAASLAASFASGAYEISDYNTACYFALSGNKKLALVYLTKAVKDGFNNSKAILKDSDLTILHGEPEWSSLVKSVQENELKQTTENNLFFNQPGFWESKFFQTPYRENISEDEKIAGLSKFWSEAKYNFVNFDLIPEINIDSLYFEYLPKVKNTKSTLEYYTVLTEMCAKLKDGHTNIYPPEELQNDVSARPLVRTRLIEDKVLIVEADSALQKNGIKAGMEILTVNGLPVKEYAAKFITPYQSASTSQNQHVRTYDYALLAGSTKQPLFLTLTDEKGKISEHTILRVTPAERSLKMNYPAAEYKRLPGNISYLAINSFATDSGSKVFTKKYTELAQSKAIILDLRNNGGGSTDWKILSYFIDTTTLVHKMYTRKYISTFRAWQLPQGTLGNEDVIDPYKLHLSKPIIILTSARTFSAAEDFVAAFKALKVGTIIGEATGGSTGQPLGITLPGHLTARICTKRDQFPNGNDFVGKGIQPDITVLPTINDIRKGVDTQLEAALKELKK